MQVVNNHSLLEGIIVMSCSESMLKTHHVPSKGKEGWEVIVSPLAAPLVINSWILQCFNDIVFYMVQPSSFTAPPTFPLKRKIIISVHAFPTAWKIILPWDNSRLAHGLSELQCLK